MDRLEDLIQETFKVKGVRKLKDVSGGLVNKAALYEMDHEKIFVKYSSSENANDMFKAEELGLHLIAETGEIRTPAPREIIRNPKGGAVFVMEYLDELQPIHSCWEKLGEQVAKLHLHNRNLLEDCQRSEGFLGKTTLRPVDKYGFYSSTFYGPSFSVPPIWTDTWPEYYVRYLLQPLFEVTGQDREMRELWSELQLIIHRIFDGLELKPSLVHGDFCLINLGQIDMDPVLFDPCCLYAPAEFDLTIPFMENNFSASFFQTYHSAIPRQPKFEYLVKAHLLFAHTLCSSFSSESHQMALTIGKELLEHLAKT